MPHSNYFERKSFFPFFVAPMVGLTHVAFRSLVSLFLPPSLKSLVFTEMWNSQRIPHEGFMNNPYTRVDLEREPFLAIQLLGNDPEAIKKSIAMIQKEIRPLAIDINMGCPVNRVLKHNWGVAMMGDLNYAQNAVKWAKSALNEHTLLSVKLRIGNNEKADYSYFEDFLLALFEGGCDFITVHPRLAIQKRRGPLRFDFLETFKAKYPHLSLVANGDVQSAQDALDLKKLYAVDGVMLGRAVLIRPWIFWQILEKLADQERSEQHSTIYQMALEELKMGLKNCSFPLSSVPQTEVEEWQALCWCLDIYYQNLCTYFVKPEERFKRLRFYTHWLSFWFVFSTEIPSLMHRAENDLAAYTALKNYLASPKVILKQTGLLH